MIVLGFIAVLGLLMLFIEQTHHFGALCLGGAIVTGILIYFGVAEPFNYVLGGLCGLAAYAYSH